MRSEVISASLTQFQCWLTTDVHGPFPKCTLSLQSSRRCHSWGHVWMGTGINSLEICTSNLPVDDLVTFPGHARLCWALKQSHCREKHKGLMSVTQDAFTSSQQTNHNAPTSMNRLSFVYLNVPMRFWSFAHNIDDIYSLFIEWLKSKWARSSQSVSFTAVNRWMCCSSPLYWTAPWPFPFQRCYAMC